MDVSQSKIECWRSCRNRFYYRYTLKLEKKNKPYHLLRGTIVHDMLEAHYKGLNPWKPYSVAMDRYKSLFRVEREEYGDLKNDLKLLMKGYFLNYKKDVEILEVESEFRVPLTTKIYLTGKIDAIAREQRLKWLMEHKCVNIIPEGSTVPYTNLQSSIYLWVKERLTGKMPDGVLWNYLRGKKLSKPQLLKDGSLSKRGIDATWSMYKHEILSNDLDVKDYLDMKKSLEGKETSFFQRKYLPTNQTLIKNVIADTITTAQEIEKYGGKDRTRNLTKNCDYCEFKDPCLSELKGLDTKWIIKQNFKERKKP